MKSYIADNIMREYRNKSTDLCEIRRNIDGNLQCVNKKI